MAKTLKQIADEISVSKQENISKLYQYGIRMCYDEASENRIKSAFLSYESNFDTYRTRNERNESIYDVIKRS